jgi:hypothetical protein
MDESLWPARNVAEYAYCPRLFYYMQVEGIFVPAVIRRKGWLSIDVWINPAPLWKWRTLGRLIPNGQRSFEVWL